MHIVTYITNHSRLKLQLTDEKHRSFEKKSKICRSNKNLLYDELHENKIRNRMKQESVVNNLHVRAYMQRNSICCHEFVHSKEMLAPFTKDIYVRATDNSNSEHSDMEDDI